ncbi:metallophosphoesterase [Croceiramulus getboli]|nr:metallophosphoesterase [Flavobacteriaceae bacterium YJPT1-3]
MMRPTMNTMHRVYWITLCCLLQPLYVLLAQEVQQFTFNGDDGPYLINDSVYWVDQNNELVKISRTALDSIPVTIDHEDDQSFFVPLNSSNAIARSEYALPEKLIAISDIEGRFDAFYSFLVANKVMDEQFRWQFGKGHLVLVGDFVDRGKNVTQVLWLIYKLEQEAEQAGGRVHFLLGNHELLNFTGDVRYNRGKYLKVAQDITGLSDHAAAVQYLYSEKTVLGQWMRTKNTVLKVGNYLFVHAGLSPELLNFNLTLEEINSRIRETIQSPDQNDVTAEFLFGAEGPLWYRGYVYDHHHYPKIEQAEFDRLLTKYKADHIVIGHTVVDDISTDFEGKLIRIDVPHSSRKFSGKTKGLLVENETAYWIDDQGNKQRLD